MNWIFWASVSSASTSADTKTMKKSSCIAEARVAA